MIVYFSGPNDEPYGHLATNFLCPIAIDSVVYPSIAHWMLCAQCLDPNLREEIRTSEYSKARQIFVSKHIPRKPLVELKALLEGIMQKYIQHPEEAKKLMETGDSLIVCGTKDRIYGCGLTREEWEQGKTPKGKNQLGISLMRAREILLKEKEKKL